jgi:hypothetical protein
LNGAAEVLAGMIEDDLDAGSSGLTLLDSARIIGGYRWIEARLFEVLGSWVTTETVDDARLLFDVQSQLHAWHSELWAERLPSVEGVTDPDSVTVAPNEGVEELVSELGGSHDGEFGSGTLVRLVGLARVVLPRLLSGYLRHQRLAVPASDAPVVRALRLTIVDEIEAWQQTELMVQVLIRRPHDVAVVTAYQQHLESLIAGSGPGLVPWPEGS